MSVIYKPDNNITTRLWSQWNSYYFSPSFKHWLWNIKIPYALDIVPYDDNGDIIITFKEEKDLTLFLLSL